MDSIVIKIGGKQREICFGIEVLGRIQHDLSINILDIGQALDTGNLFMLIPTLIHRGHEWALIRDKKEVDFTKDDVYEWLKESKVYTADNVKLFSAFSDTLQSFLPEAEEPQKKSKQKSTGKLT